MIRSALALAALLLASQALAQSARPWHGMTAEELAETFPPEQIRSGTRISREECERLKLSVWVEHRYGTECIRYFPSSNIRGAARAAFFFHGDLLYIDGTILQGATRGNNVDAKLKEAAALAKINGLPFVTVSRPGTLGSSGEHLQRRAPKEFYSMNAAVDTIKARYGVREVMLTGQSGGATIVG